MADRGLNITVAIENITFINVNNTNNININTRIVSTTPFNTNNNNHHHDNNNYIHNNNNNKPGR